MTDLPVRDARRRRIAEVMREHYLCTNRDEADADGNMPCRCGDWREPGAEVDDENDWDSHLADAVLDALPELTAQTADRAAILREAISAAEDEARHLYDDIGQKAAAGARLVADRLRRMADETHQPEPDATDLTGQTTDQTAEPVCICGHPQERHFKDVCQTCGCGDYLEPRDAAEVIARWRQAAFKVRDGERAAAFREAAEDLATAFGDPKVKHIGAVAASHLRRRARELEGGKAGDEQPETPLEKRFRYSERRNDELRAECKRRGKTVLDQAEKIERMEKQLDEVRTQLGAEILRAGQAEAELRRLADEAQPTTQMPDEDPARIDRIRPEFTEHASIESIDVQLRRARAQERRWHLRAEWLISLRADRVAQKERGEWAAAGAEQDGVQQ